jgi:hypothetical protein
MIKKIIDKGFFLQTAAIVTLKDFLRADRIRSDREIVIKTNLCRRFIDKNLRETHRALQMLKYHSQEELDKEQLFYSKLRGICNRFQSGNMRLLTMGYNKLIEEHKLHLQNLRDKIRFILASVQDVDKRHVLMAYNGLKINMHVQDGVGIYNEFTEKQKSNLIRKITETSSKKKENVLGTFKDLLAQSRVYDQSMLWEDSLKKKV